MDTLNLHYLMWDRFLNPKKVAFGDLKEEDFAQVKVDLKTKIAEHLENRKLKELRD